MFFENGLEVFSQQFVVSILFWRIERKMRSKDYPFFCISCQYRIQPKFLTLEGAAIFISQFLLGGRINRNDFEVLIIREEAGVLHYFGTIIRLGKLVFPVWVKLKTLIIVIARS